MPARPPFAVSRRPAGLPSSTSFTIRFLSRTVVAVPPNQTLPPPARDVAAAPGPGAPYGLNLCAPAGPSRLHPARRLPCRRSSSKGCAPGVESRSHARSVGRFARPLWTAVVTTAEQRARRDLPAVEAGPACGGQSGERAPEPYCVDLECDSHRNQRAPRPGSCPGNGAPSDGAISTGSDPGGRDLGVIDPNASGSGGGDLRESDPVELISVGAGFTLRARFSARSFRGQKSRSVADRGPRGCTGCGDGEPGGTTANPS